jgi:dihydropteroate synthase
MLNNYFSCGSLKIMPGKRTYIMGIINITPDSFSDGACFSSTQQAIDYGLKLLDQGADILDIGGVSTAPHIPAGFTVSIEEEFERVIPVIKGLRKRGVSALSLDTSRAAIALAGLEHGAKWINDQEAGRADILMPQVLAQAQACVLMHRKGRAGVAAGEHYIYTNIIQEISDFFEQQLACLAEAGVSRQQVILDPGIGFGKGLADSLTLIKNIHKFTQGVAILVGASRKSFLGALTKIADPKERDNASLGAIAAAIMNGAHIVRVHNVKATYEMTQVLDACVRNNHEDLHQAR